MRLLAVLLLFAAAGSAQGPQTAPEWLSRGVQAFKSARYAEAATAFQKATDLDPNLPAGWLYLGTANMQQYVPGLETPANRDFADKAGAAFRRVLEIDPNNRVALASLGSLNLNQKRWEAARAWYKQLIDVDPNNADAYYSLAFIDWAQWYPAYGEAREKVGLAPAQPGPIPDPAVRTALRSEWWTTIEDGIWNLNRALEINPKHSDAMAYMNLFLRERADLQDTPREYQQDVAAADQWVQRTLEAKREQAAQRMAAGTPPPPGTPATPQRIRLSNTANPALLTRVEPVYPPLALQARIQGTVKFSAVIDKQGRVMNLQVLSGHPLLVPAAIEAVRQWVYQPTLLNGEPVEVMTQIDLNFALP